LTDVLDLNQTTTPICPADANTGDDQKVTTNAPPNFMVAGMQMSKFSGTISPALTANACNTAEVSCNIDDGTGNPVHFPCVSSAGRMTGTTCQTSADCENKVVSDTGDAPCGGPVCSVRLDKTINAGSLVDQGDFPPNRVNGTATAAAGSTLVTKDFIVENTG